MKLSAAFKIHGVPQGERTKLKQEDVSIELVYKSLKKNGIKALHCSDPILPDLLAIDPNRGLMSIFVFVEGNFSGDEEAVKVIKKRNRALAEEIHNLTGKRILIPLTILQTPKKGSNKSFNIPLDIYPNGTTNQLEESELKLLYGRFNTKYSFVKRRRINQDDPYIHTRRVVRATLDRHQRGIVDLESKEVLLVTGPAGSGKSLVLIARAKKLASENPDWNIAYISYNKSLTRVVRDELYEFQNISVQTFSEFVSSRNAKFSFYKKVAGEKISVSEEKTQIELKYARASGILRDIDAIFIDEVQDLWPAWLQYCIECQVLGRGGATIAGDSSQSLYVRSDIKNAIDRYDKEIVELRYPYRNTVEILKFTEILTGIPQVTENVPRGIPPGLIYVDTTTERNNVNRAVIHDVLSLLSQPEISAGDIAILVTRHHMKYALRGQLQEALDIKYAGKLSVDSIQKGFGDGIDMGRDSIKILTAHSAKGLSFPIVLLLGLDLLYTGDEDDVLGEEARNLLLVAPTRASDQLFVYLSSMPDYISPIKANPHLYSFRVFPEDFVEE